MITSFLPDVFNRLQDFDEEFTPEPNLMITEDDNYMITETGDFMILE